MFSRIMVPVDLTHADRLRRSLSAAADLARLHGATVCYVGVTAPLPGPAGRTPEEFAEKLADFARSQAETHGVRTDSLAVVSGDPVAEMEDALLDAVKTTKADLVIMATHVPNLSDLLWPSNGGRIAAHADASVFLVRGG